MWNAHAVPVAVDRDVKQRFVLPIHAKTVERVVSVQQVMQCVRAAPHGRVAHARYLFSRVRRIRARIRVPAN